MKVMRRIKAAVWTVAIGLVAALLWGCRGEEPRSTPDQQKISFGIATSGFRSGRFATTDNFYPDQGMGVTAYLHDGDWSTVTTSSIYFHNLQLKPSGGYYNSGYPWLGNGSRNFSFFAYAPYGAGKFTGHQLQYAVPEDIAKQVDLVVAQRKDIPANSNAPVALTFKHILTALSFATHTDLYTCTVKSIELSGIPSQGTYDISKGGWNEVSGSANYLFQPNASHTSGESITLEPPLFILPGTMPAGAVLKVTLGTQSGDTYSYEVDLNGTKFQAGQHVTVRLSTAGIQLEVEGVPWSYHEYKKGFLNQDNILMVEPPKWKDGNSTLTTKESEVHLTFRILQPVGVAWHATLTNGLDFAFKEGTPSGGIASAGAENVITIVPRRPQGDTDRTTEVYLVLYNQEIDPDLMPDGNGPLGIGKGNRLKVTQKRK